MVTICSGSFIYLNFAFHVKLWWKIEKFSKVKSASIFTRSTHPIVPKRYILFKIFGKTWNISTQIFWGVLRRNNIPKTKYLFIWSTFRKNIFSWKICNFQNPSYTQKFLYTYLLELPRLKMEALLNRSEVLSQVWRRSKKINIFGKMKPPYPDKCFFIGRHALFCPTRSKTMWIVWWIFSWKNSKFCAHRSSKIVQNDYVEDDIELRSFLKFGFKFERAQKK